MRSVTFDAVVLGTVTDTAKIELNGKVLDLDDLIETWNGKLEKIFANKAETVAVEYDVPLDNHKYTGSPVIRVAKPKVFIPVFPGTNCEIDTKRAFEKAGAETEILVVQNLCAKDIEYTIDRMEKAIRSSQIIMIPGGFSGGDEPEGSPASSSRQRSATRRLHRRSRICSTRATVLCSASATASRRSSSSVLSPTARSWTSRTTIRP